jgi:thiamine-phosphate pyrophosphorylase
VQGRRRRQTETEGVGFRLEVNVRLFLPTDLGVATRDTTIARAREVIGAVHDPRAVVFGVRDRTAPATTRLALARSLIEVARPVGARVVVHDRVDICLAAGADGVQLGEQSIGVREARTLLSGGWVGRSCHDARGVREAMAAGVDAILLSPLFASPGKGAPLGLDAFADLATLTLGAVPLIALGGIDASNARAARAAGATGVAAIRGWLTGDVGAFVRSIGDADQTP